MSRTQLLGLLLMYLMICLPICNSTELNTTDDLVDLEAMNLSDNSVSEALNLSEIMSTNDTVSNETTTQDNAIAEFNETVTEIILEESVRVDPENIVEESGDVPFNNESVIDNISVEVDIQAHELNVTQEENNSSYEDNGSDLDDNKMINQSDDNATVLEKTIGEVDIQADAQIDNETSQENQSTSILPKIIPEQKPYDELKIVADYQIMKINNTVNVRKHTKELFKVVSQEPAKFFDNSSWGYENAGKDIVSSDKELEIIDGNYICLEGTLTNTLHDNGRIRVSAHSNPHCLYYKPQLSPAKGDEVSVDLRKIGRLDDKSFSVSYEEDYDPGLVNLSSNCNSTCTISTAYYTATLTEGAINEFYSAYYPGYQWAGSGTGTASSLGQLYCGVWAITPGNTSTNCVVQSTDDYIIADCQNTLGRNKWTFYPTYVLLNSTCNSAYRSYFYTWANSTVQPHSDIWNGTANLTDAGWDYADTASTTGTMGFSYSPGVGLPDGILVVTWDQNVKTDFDYRNIDPATYIVGAIARNDEISSGTWLAQYIKVLQPDSSATGAARYTTVMSGFKADPTYGDPSIPGGYDNPEIDYTGDCNSRCTITTPSYAINMKEGVIASFNYSDSFDWTKDCDANGECMGEIYGGAWRMTGTIDSSCTITETEDYLQAYCSNANAENKWFFYNTYIKLESKVYASNYRVYSFASNKASNAVTFFNGTDDLTYYNGWLSGGTAKTGVGGFTYTALTDNMFAWAWNENLTTNMDYGEYDGSGWAGIAVGRTTYDISANNAMTSFFKVIPKDGSQTGTAQYTVPLNAFKANPLYGDALSITYSGDCSSMCTVNTGSYNVTLTEGVISHYFDSREPSFDWAEYCSGVSGSCMGELNGGTASWVLTAAINSNCVVTQSQDYLRVYCSNANAENDWYFYDTHIQLKSKVYNDAWRIYAYNDNKQDSTTIFYNGASSYTPNMNWQSGTSSSGIAGYSFTGVTNNIFAWAWDQAKTTNFDYKEDTNPGYDFIGMAVGRSSTISSNNQLVSYFKIIPRNESASGTSRYNTALNSFKADPLYGDNIEPPTQTGYSLTYDNNGNLVTGDGFYRQYNSLNQLWQVRSGSTAGGTLLERYNYHPTEERVIFKEAFNPDGTYKERTYYFDQNFVRVINSSGTFDITYVYHEGHLVAQKIGGTTLYMHTDHEGNVVAVTNAAGNLVERTSYTPYGDVISGGTASRLSHEGKETSLAGQDFNFRMNKPEWGMFTQPDTLIPSVYDPQSLNRYAFERRNPYGNKEEQGHVAIPIATGAIGGIIGWGIGAGYSAYSQYRDTGSIDMQQVGQASLVGATAGFVTGATFGLATPMLAQAAEQGGAATAAPLVGIAGGVSNVAGGQAAVATNNLLSGQSITEGMGDTQQMGGDFLLGAGTSMVTYGISTAISSTAKSSSSGTSQYERICVDPKGNAIPLQKGQYLTGSSDGKYLQVRNADGTFSGMRIDGGHSSYTHNDIRAQQPHAHVPGITNEDGSEWLKIN
jgi:hypothetical protein